MTFSFKNISLVFMVLLCFLVLLLASGCITGQHGSNSYGDIAATGVPNRRELRVIEKKKKVVEWELRKAPSGPDPIHHNAAHPNKPTTTSPPTRY